MVERDFSVMVVRPKQPYLDWTRSDDDQSVQVSLEDLRHDCTAYVVPVVESPEDEQRVVRKYHAQVFENELFSWSTDPSTWPKRRGLKTFREWFDVEFHSVVMSLTGA